VVRGVHFPVGGVLRRAVPLSRKFSECYAWKWCILVHFLYYLGFHVEGLNTEIGGGLKTELAGAQPFASPFTFLKLLQTLID